MGKRSLLEPGDAIAQAHDAIEPGDANEQTRLMTLPLRHLQDEFMNKGTGGYFNQF